MKKKNRRCRSRKGKRAFPRIEKKNDESVVIISRSHGKTRRIWVRREALPGTLRALAKKFPEYLLLLEESKLLLEECEALAASQLD